MTAPALVWFREDLRIDDNPALNAAGALDQPVLCLFILEEHDNLRPPGSATRWWLHHSLVALQKQLKDRKGTLILRKGDPERILPEICAEADVDRVFWNRRYEPGAVCIDKAIKACLKGKDVRVESFNGNRLAEPWDVTTNSGDPYKVFTPFWKAVLARGEPPQPEKLAGSIGAPTFLPDSDRLEDWGLLPEKPDWAAGFHDFWTPGAAGAQTRLDDFLENGLPAYADGRDIPSRNATSGLSPHLRWGDISPRQIWHGLAARQSNGFDKNGSKFLAELGWRDFSNVILHYADDLRNKNWRPEFDNFPWKESEKALKRWQTGRTGFPFVDAGMRELWQSGGMHNRIRMVTASFLIKNLMIDWREGEAWFWDTLVDADPASNPASWQWVAGSGADAAPFFRIFNPVTQGKKFDPEADYIKKWVPELVGTDAKTIHKLASADFDGIRPDGYPAPIVDHKKAREAALAAYQEIKKEV